MTREETFDRLEKIFREVFDDESIVLNETTVSEDIDGWDSFEHVNLIVAIEDEFKFKVPLNKVVSMENVGEMVDIILEMGN